MNNKTNEVEKTDGDVEEVMKTIYWKYENDMYKFWFDIVNNNHERDSRVSTFRIPETWIELSTDQATKLAGLVKKQQNMMKNEAKVYV